MNMPTSIDIDLLPLYRRAGQDQSVLPGLLTARPPRRCARSREADQLILHLVLTGNITLPLDLTSQLLDGLVKAYYETSGSATAALRTTADALNQTLLKRNLRSTSGQQTIGMLTLAALRSGQMYLAQSGLVYALYLTDGAAQELYDPALSGRGLGTNQSIILRYFHASLQPGDMFLLAVQPPVGWNAQALTGLYGQSMEYQQRRLLEPVMDANGVLLNVKPGSGQVVLLPARQVQPARFDQSQAMTPTAPIPSAYPSATQPVIPTQPVDDLEDQAREQALLDQYQPLPELEILPENGLPLASEAISISSSPKNEALPGQKAAVAEAVARSEPAHKAAPASPGVGRRIGRRLQSWFTRLLPEETLAAIPNSVFAFMAIVVPLVVVAMATAVYFQRGLAAQSEVAYQQAVQAVQQAQVQTEPLQRRNGLDTALQYLNAADSYRKLPETEVLRQSVLAELDALDLVRRLDYQPAIVGDLPAGVNITRMVVVDTDLYLLDSLAGKVYRAFYTPQGYQLDPVFQCGPGSPANVGPLIDLSAWPFSNEPNARVVGMDAKGMLLFCLPDEAAQPKKLPDPPTGAFSNLAGFALDQNDLYVLDPGANAVWVYWGGDFEGEPAYYFNDQPPALQDIVDLAANNEELYLLHADGQMTMCVTGALGEVTPNRCSDPAAYIDLRIGREGASIQPIPAYSQIQYSTPPDPSLYLLEEKKQAVDRYSLRNLNFQSRYLPDQQFPDDATAAWVDPVGRLAFLAIGDRVYYTNLP